MRSMHETAAFGGMKLEQADGTPPAVLASGQALGESGVSILAVRFQGSAHFRATAAQHLVFFKAETRAVESGAPMDCRMDSRRLRHAPPAGSLAICPAGIEGAAEAAAGFDCIILAVDPARLALATAEDSAPEARLIERLQGMDGALFRAARRLAAESRAGYPNGPLLWNALADGFIDGLAARHVAESAPQTRGRLGQEHFKRIRDHILANLEQPIDVATLAGIAGRSPFHFTRVFARSIGMTPHRYIVHLRLRRALEMARSEAAGLAEIAAATGFADQSHLWRWVRRVYGVPLTQLSSARFPTESFEKQQESSRPDGMLFPD